MVFVLGRRGISRVVVGVVVVSAAVDVVGEVRPASPLALGWWSASIDMTMVASDDVLEQVSQHGAILLEHIAGFGGYCALVAFVEVGPLQRHVAEFAHGMRNSERGNRFF